MARSRRSMCAVVLVAAVCVCLATTFFQLGRHWDEDTGGVPGPRRPSSFSVSAGGSMGSGTAVASSLEAMQFAKTHFQPPRYTSHVSTDMPLYRPGDSVRVRVVALSALGRAPVSESEHPAPCKVEITMPRGDTATTMHLNFRDSVAGGVWEVPRGTPGGVYKVKVSYDQTGWPPAEREFRVREFHNPSLRLQLKFAKDGYGAGDEVTATVTATRASGGVPVGARVTFMARVDGAVVAKASSPLKIGEDGTCTLSFTLPASIERGDGSLNVVVRDGGDMETVSKSLPLLLAAFDIDVYPEGGDLVAGLPSRVYVEGSIVSGDPADFAAVITSVSASGEVGEVVATVDTQHEGRGVSTAFVPEAGAMYQLRVTRPASVKQAVPLPEAKLQGGVLSVGNNGVVGPEQPVSVQVAVTEPGTYVVALFRREAEVAQSTLHFGEGGAAVGAGVTPTTVVLTPPATSLASGVLRATLYNMDKGEPVAERLLFRQPRAMSVSVTTDKPVYNPGDTVTLSVATTYGGGSPMPAIAGVTVTDDSVLQKVERRRQPPRLPVMALLEHEVSELADAHTYLGDMFPSELPVTPSQDADADPAGATKAVCRATVDPAVSLDLLLGTQGWRRFVYENPREFLGAPPAGAGGRPGGFHHRGNDAGDSGSKLPQRSQEEFDRAERLFGVHHAEPRVFATGMAMGGMARGGFNQKLMAPMAMPAMAPMPEMAMDGAAGGGPPQAMLFGAPQIDADVAVMADNAGENGVAGGLDLTAAEAGGALDDAAMEEDEAVEGGPGLAGGMVGDAAMDMNMGDAAPPPMPPRAPIMHDAMMKDDGALPPAGRPMRAKRQHAGRMHRPAYHQRPGFQRQFAFKRRANRKPNDRSDFTNTVFWEAGSATDNTGVATFTFDLSDSVTSFRVEVDGFSSVASLLGSATIEIKAVEPFYARMRLPIELTDGDRVSIPVTTVLSSPPSAGADVSLVPVVEGTALRLSDSVASSGLSLQQSQRSTRTYLNAHAVLPPPPTPGADGDAAAKPSTGAAPAGPANRVAVPAQMSLTATAVVRDQHGGAQVSYVDRVTRQTRVMPHGFPQLQSSGGMVAAPGDAQEWTVVLPEDVVPNSLTASVAVYPTPVASITKALESLIRRPCGCFEQTSATTYPLTMAAQYFQTHSGVDPDLLKRSREMLEEGYKKLEGFESDGGGFEWFGQSPGHEALTAYGALQFEDMAKVMSVDEAMLQRTREWLLARRDQKGGFLRNPKSLDSFGRAPDEITNAYIVWALTGTSLRDKLSEEVEALAVAADESAGGAFKEDPYFLGLVSGALYNVGQTERAGKVAERLLRSQAKDGSVEGAKTSITCSRMSSLSVEATSVSILAWLNDDRFAANARSAVEWLASQCSDGGFGSTQATVLALKAIIAYDLKTAKPPSSGSVTLVVDGEKLETIEFGADVAGALQFKPKQVAAALSAGGKSHTLAVSMDTATPFSMPYSMSVEYYTPQPHDAPTTPITIATSLSETRVPEGGATELRVVVTNTDAGEPQPMTVAQVGLPSGLELRHDKVEELIAAGQVAFYELDGRTLNLYWRGMAPGQVLDLSLDVVGALPGTFTGDASRVYPYYADELEHWVPGLRVEVVAAGSR